jgi:DNA ligase-1
MSLPKLYKTKNGKTLFWQIAVSHTAMGVPCYIVQHGYVGGATQYTSTDIPVGKNIGKASETTPLQQCQLEAESLWKKQRDRKGYSEQINPAKVELAPMLAHSYDDHKNKVKFPLLIQPKLDGIRCLSFMRNGEVVLLSRQRKEFKHLNHIRQALLPIFKKSPDLVLDGELYRHGMEFQSIISAVKRDEASALTSEIEYHIYDNCNTEYGCYTRQFYLDSLWILKPLRRVVTVEVKSFAEIDKMHEHYTSRGYEGIMLRNTHGMYVPDKRSHDLLKYKKFKDEEFLIVGAEENVGKCKGQCSLICVTKDGTQFKVKPEGSDSERRRYWDDYLDGKLKGKYITVRFFSWTDSTPAVPRFPVGVAIRDYD